MWSQKNKEANIKTADTVTFNKMNKCGIFPFISLRGMRRAIVNKKVARIICWQFIGVSLKPRVNNTKWLMKVANQKWMSGHTSLGPGAKASKRVYSHPRIGIPGFANKNIGCPIIQLVDSWAIEFDLTGRFFFSPINTSSPFVFASFTAGDSTNLLSKTVFSYA